MESQLQFAAQRPPKPGAGKILALFPGALGDFICFLPALEMLARNSRVDLLARSEYGDLAPPAVYVGSIERAEISRLFVVAAELDAAIGRFFGPYEFIYSWTGSGDPNFAQNVRRIAGHRVKLFPFRPPESQLHISDYYLDCVGMRAEERSSRILLKPDALLWSRRWLIERGFERKKILALAPGSGAREKNWPAEFFRQVERWWREANGGESLVIFGPAEAELFDTGDWGHAIVARDFDLAKIAALLSLSDFYLGNDSGLTHLAAAVGVETVAMFGPTSPAQWAPRGRRIKIVNQNVECSPCARQTMKNCLHRKCLTTLSPEVIIGLLRGRNSAQR